MLELRNGVLIIKQGDHGIEVEYIQELLDLKVDGKFGPKTKLAVIEFQSNNDLQPDGVIGPTTFVKLTKKKLEIQFYRSKKSLEIQLTRSHSSGIHQIFKCKAISGLPKGHSRVSQLIEEGRDDLDTKTNYMLSKYDDVSDVGPIPDGDYDLPLTKDMPFQKSGGGWGVGGWFLDPGLISRGFYKFGISRGGFFLHHDGNGIGTGGCIGVESGSKMRSIQTILTAYKDALSRDDIEVTVH